MDTQSFTVRSSFQREAAVFRGCWWCLLLLALVAGLPHHALGQMTQAATVPLLYPSAIAYDAAGVLYVAETNRHVIDRLDAAGGLTVVAGDGSQGFSGDGGPARAAQLDSPGGLALDAAGNVYIADTHNHRVRMVAASTGTITTIAGTGAPGFSGDGGLAAGAALSGPTALALDGAGNLYIADSNNHRIRELVHATGVMLTVAGNGVEGSSGDGGAATAASVDTPSGIAVDGSGDLYLSDTRNGRIRKVAHDTGTISTLAGRGLDRVGGAGSGGQVVAPKGLSVAASGNVYVADTGVNRILRVGADGTVTIAAGAGLEGFAGDQGPATEALLDRPRGVAVSTSGALGIADTGNQRVRVMGAGGSLETLAGVGAEAPGVLSLAAPTVIQYGTGVVTATLASGRSASGLVTFLEAVAGAPAMLGAAPLIQGVASLSTTHLGAGPHRLLATYPGDGGHASVQSSVILLTISPVAVTATPQAANVLYGQTLPPLTGTLAGVLPQDEGLVSAVFSSSAGATPPVGAYPVSAVLTGAAAANYRIGSLPVVDLVVGQAPTVTSISTPASSLQQGVAELFSARVVSTTTSIPTGRLTFADGGVNLGSVALDGSGAGSVSASLGVGSHAISARYGGDANFLASASTVLSEVIAPAPAVVQDFALSATGASTQTAASGSLVNFPFAVTMQNGPLNSPILLTAAGLPSGATATFNPGYVPPGATAPAFTLAVQTVKVAARVRREPREWPAVGVMAALLLPLLRLRRLRRTVALCGVALGMAGCGDRIAQLPASEAAVKSYTILVTATSTLPSGAVLQHAASVNLILQ